MVADSKVLCTLTPSRTFELRGVNFLIFVSFLVPY